jgi:hypothetical protein
MDKIRKNISILFKLILLLFGVFGLIYFINTLGYFNIININVDKNIVFESIVFLLHLTVKSGIIWLLMCLVLVYLNKKVKDIPKQTLLEMRRQGIISPYAIDMNGIRDRIDRGSKIYVENSGDGIFIKLYKKEGVFYVERMGDGKVVRYKCDSILSDIRKLQIERGFSVYDEEAYDLMVINGYIITGSNN